MFELMNCNVFWTALCMEKGDVGNFIYRGKKKGSDQMSC